MADGGGGLDGLQARHPILTEEPESQEQRASSPPLFHCWACPAGLSRLCLPPSSQPPSAATRRAPRLLTESLRCGRGAQGTG